MPRALLFWEYAPLWLTLLAELGLETVVSGETTRGTLDLGVKLAVEEACLPVKVCFGHCVELAGAADRIFLPRLVAVESRAYICPKFMGLPDMVRRAVGGTERLIAPLVDLRRREGSLQRAADHVASATGKSRLAARRALHRALRMQASAERRWGAGELPPNTLQALGLLPSRARPAAARPGANPAPSVKGRLGVLGHPYDLYDPAVSMSLLPRLTALGWEVATPETVSPADRANGALRLRKELFWTFGRRVYGAAVHLMAPGRVNGLIHLVSFGCGPDSMIGELVAREAERCGVPFLLLTLDEHTGEAGVWTRIEAFLDMLERREMSALRRN